MASKAKKYIYKVDADKRNITIDTTVKPTEQDERDLEIYVKVGYVIRHKSVKRSDTMKNRTKGGLTDTAIKEALKSNKKALEEYNRIKAAKGEGGGFFAARKYAQQIINETATAKK